MLRRFLIATTLTVALVTPLATTTAAAAPTITPIVSVRPTPASWATLTPADRNLLEREVRLLSLNRTDLMQPDGWWGWTVCVSTVILWAGTNAFAAAKVAALIRKAGSIRAAVEKAQRAVALASRAQKARAVASALLGVAGEVVGVGGIVDACFS